MKFLKTYQVPVITLLSSLILILISFLTAPITLTLFSANFHYYQLFTYIFFHDGFWHLAGNLSLYLLFASEVERKIKYHMLWIIPFSGALGGLFWLFQYWLFHKAGIILYLLGFSPVVFCFIIIYLLITKNSPVFLFYIFPIKKIYLLLILFSTQLLSLTNEMHIACISHVGGMVAGVIVVMILSFFKLVK